MKYLIASAIPLAALASHIIIISSIPIPLACILGFTISALTSYYLTIAISNLLRNGQLTS